MLGSYRYRLATRRYVLDLFSDLTLDVASAAAIRSAAAQAKATRQPHPRPDFIDLGGLRFGRRSTSSNYERKRLPSGSAILEAYDKQDYLSDSDGDDVDHDVGVEGAKRAPRHAPKPERLEPLLTIRGFLQ